MEPAVIAGKIAAITLVVIKSGRAIVFLEAMKTVQVAVEGVVLEQQSIHLDISFVYLQLMEQVHAHVQ